MKLSAQGAHTTVSWLPSSLDPPSLDLGTSFHSWFQRQRELLALCFSLAPPSSPPNEIRQAARITKQHSGQRQFDFKEARDAHALSEAARGSQEETLRCPVWATGIGLASA